MTQVKETFQEADGVSDPETLSPPAEMSSKKEAQDAEATPSTSSPPPPPDGGLFAWLQVAGAFFLFFNSWGIVNTFGVYQAFYEKNILNNETSSNIAWIGSLQAFLLLTVGVLTGPLFDKGFVRHLILAGTFLVVFGLMMTSLITEFWQAILAQGFCVGIGAGCLFIPSVAIVSTYFDAKRIFATGIAAAGSSVGGVIYPIIFFRLQSRIGFGWATRVVAFIALATLVLPCICMRPRLQAKSARSLLLPRAFKEVPYTLVTAGLTVGLMALYIPFFFVSSYAQEQAKAGEVLSIYLLPILNAASTAGRVLPGYLADRLSTGPLNILIPSTTAATILAFAWIGIHNEPGIIVFCILYGFFSGTFVSLPPAAIASLSPDLSEIGTRMGMSFFFAGLGVLIGTPIAGVLINVPNFLHTQIFCAVLLTVAIATLVAARISKTGLTIRAKA